MPPPDKSSCLPAAFFQELCLGGREPSKKEMNGMKGIICEKRVYNDRAVTHSHPYAQLVFPLCGSMNVRMNGGVYTADENSILLLPYGRDHFFHVDGRNQFLIMGIPSRMFEGKGMNFSEAIRCGFDQKWKAIRFLLLDEMQNSPDSPDAFSRLFYYFIPEMLRHDIPNSVQYINEHYQENIEIETLARIENYSATYYGEWFKKNMGQSPVEYIQFKRIERAKELLCGTNLSIMRIALEVGYNYESSFTNVFKFRENISPKAYRQKYS